jgi:hypothetical protein
LAVADRPMAGDPWILDYRKKVMDEFLSEHSELEILDRYNHLEDLTWHNKQNILMHSSETGNWTVSQMLPRKRCIRCMKSKL